MFEVLLSKNVHIFRSNYILIFDHGLIKNFIKLKKIIAVYIKNYLNKIPQCRFLR